MEKTFNEQDSIRVITEMIENSKAKIKDNGFFYLLWGWLVLVASVTNTLIISLYGLGTFVSGGILKFKPLIFGGIFSWVIAIVALFIPEIYSLLMVSLSVIVAYLIPGYMLKSRNKNLSHV